MSDLAELRLKAMRMQAEAMRARVAGSLPPPPQPDAQGAINLPDGTRMVLDPKTGSYTNAELMAGNMQPTGLEAANAGAFQGMGFGWGDELAALLGASPLTQERVQAGLSSAQRDRPGSYLAGAIGGGALGAGATAMAARAIPGVSSLMSKIGGGSLLTQSAAGLGAGALMGAVQGAGEAQPGQRASGAAIGGAIGGAVGAASPSIIAGLRAGSTKVLNYLKGTDLSGIKRALGVSDEAAKIIQTYIANDDFKAAADAMDRAGSGAMLADSSPQASQLLDSAVQAGGPAQRIARDAVEGRSAAASDNLKTAMDAILGPPEGMRGAAMDISAKTAAARKAAYDAAYGSAIDYAAPEGQAIEDVLSRIPEKTFNAAIQEANDAMKADGIKNMQIMASIAPDGKVTFTEMPNVQQLDFLKRALGTVADAEKDNFGRLTATGARASKLASDLKDAIAAAAPEYGRAVKLGGDKIAEDKALQLGRDFMKRSVTPEDVAMAAKNMSAEATIAAKKGMRAAFADAMDNVKTVASDLNLDARQAVNAAKEFSSDANRKKAAAILGQQEADRLFAEFDRASTQLALRTAVARNSATAARTAGKIAMDDIITGGPLNALKRGKLQDWGKGLVQMMTKTTPADDLARSQAIYAEVAKALTAARGQDAKDALIVVQQAMNGAPVSRAQADLVAKAITGALALGGYQAGMQRQNTLPSGPRQ